MAANLIRMAAKIFQSDIKFSIESNLKPNKYPSEDIRKIAISKIISNLNRGDYSVIIMPFVLENLSARVSNFPPQTVQCSDIHFGQSFTLCPHLLQITVQ